MNKKDIEKEISDFYEDIIAPYDLDKVSAKLDLKDNEPLYNLTEEDKPKSKWKVTAKHISITVSILATVFIAFVFVTYFFIFGFKGYQAAPQPDDTTSTVVDTTTSTDVVTTTIPDSSTTSKTSTVATTTITKTTGAATKTTGAATQTTGAVTQTTGAATQTTQENPANTIFNAYYSGKGITQFYVSNTTLEVEYFKAYFSNYTNSDGNMVFVTYISDATSKELMVSDGDGNTLLSNQAIESNFIEIVLEKNTYEFVVTVTYNSLSYEIDVII